MADTSRVEILLQYIVLTCNPIMLLMRLTGHGAPVSLNLFLNPLIHVQT